jgi:hypothetical protein
MRYKTLNFAMLICLIGAQVAAAQVQTPAMSSPAASPAAHAQGTPENMPDTNATPASASPFPYIAVQPVTREHAKPRKNKDSSNMQPDDPRKSPYWEPRDWSYIYNQGP